MLAELIEKVKIFYEIHQRDILTAAFIFFIGMFFFGLGRLSILWPTPIPITIGETPADFFSEPKSLTGSVCTENGSCQDMKIVASQQGRSYYFPWCSNTIKEANKIYFDEEEEAKKAGYQLAKNCSH